MSSTYIYTAQDRTPYTYFIRWNDLDLNYYGRRTAKGCHPEEFFILYFTSSKFVDDVISEYGMPDIIKIHKIFSNVNSCKLQEERYLKRVNAAKSLNWLNKTNGDKNFDTTGIVTVYDNTGNKFNVSVYDKRYINGELKFISNKLGTFENESTKIKKSEFRKGKTTVRDNEGNCFIISVTDERFKSGELISVMRGIGIGSKRTEETKQKLKLAANNRKSFHCVKCNKTIKGKMNWDRHLTSVKHLSLD